MLADFKQRETVNNSSYCLETNSATQRGQLDSFFLKYACVYALQKKESHLEVLMLLILLYTERSQGCER